MAGKEDEVEESNCSAFDKIADGLSNAGSSPVKMRDDELSLAIVEFLNSPPPYDLSAVAAGKYPLARGSPAERAGRHPVLQGL